MTNIKPRIDADPESPTYGVGWCDAGCNQCNNYTKAGYQFEEVQCAIDGLWRLVDAEADAIDLCPHHAARNAALLEEAQQRIEEAYKEGYVQCEVDSADLKHRPGPDAEVAWEYSDARAWIKKAGK